MAKLYGARIKSLSSAELARKVGSVRIEGKTYRGAGLKTFLTKEFTGGKSSTYVEKKLKKSGLVGYQEGKRKVLFGVLSGDKKAADLEKIKERNIKMSERSAELADKKVPSRVHASNVIEARKERTKGVGLYDESQFGIKTGSTGFAGTQNDGGQQSSHASTDVHPPV